ncbi:hypothetical protein MIR68_009029 [Amoeboaphelidium protococcarum]|nr:hypothetical protein MIR68_009029 [Amoeboaphelidium protococcarum]
MSSAILSQLYAIDHLLGKGATGAVYAGCRRSDGVPCAIKVVRKSKVPDSRLAIEMNESTGTCRCVPMEVYVLRRISHPNIIKLVDFHEDDRYFYIVTELHGHGSQWNLKQLAESDTSSQSSSSSASDDEKSVASTSSTSSTDLFECIEKLGPLQESVAAHIMRQVVSALSYLKTMNVYHMDIKDENIVVDKDFQVKLIDFGSAHIVADHNKPFDRFYGTLEFAPPEVLLGTPYFAEMADIWALGTVLYTMLHAQPPYGNPKNVLAGNLIQLRSNSNQINLSQQMTDLLSQMLCRRIIGRSSLLSINQCLNNIA